MTAGGDPGNILIIKLGALGDFIQALGPMAAIRAHHGKSRITLLTTAPFEKIARDVPYVDEVWIDDRPRIYQPHRWIDLRKRLNAGHFARVYDLQNNDRTSLYLRLFNPLPEWVGAAPGASHRNASPDRTKGNAFAGHAQTLALAGIDAVMPDDLSWMQGRNDYPGLRAPYVLIVPGASPRHPQKRWPYFAELCASLAAQQLQPVILGGKDETDMAHALATAVPDALNLCGQTPLFDIPALARNAKAAIGNDTGPMHLIAPTGCPSLVLFSGRSNPVRHAPLGTNIRTLQKDKLADLPSADVLDAFQNLIGNQP